MTYSGTVRGSDGANILSFHLQVKNEDGEIVYDQDYMNGVWTMDIVPGFEYWFSAMPNYGAVLRTSNDLAQGSVVEIPKNFDAPTASKTAMNIYYAVAAVLILLLLKKK